jgi:hypothetical protein
MGRKGNIKNIENQQVFNRMIQIKHNIKINWKKHITAPIKTRVKNIQAPKKLILKTCHYYTKILLRFSLIKKLVKTKYNLRWKINQTKRREN